VQAFTAAILVLAANTAFNGFPILASIVGQDGFLPRQFARRGDRLVFSNGIVILAMLAMALIWAFDASTTRLIQLYIIGVFVSFTLSQAGMVRHWLTLMARTFKPKERGRIRRSLAINALGAGTTALVLVIVLVTKFTHGAWIVAIAMPLVFVMMTSDSQPLRPRLHRAAAHPCRLAAAEPDPRDRAGLQAARPDAASAGLRPGDPSANTGSADRTDVAGGDRAAHARVGGTRCAGSVDGA